MVETISKKFQLSLRAEMGIQHIARKRLADQLGIAEFTLRRVLDDEAPVKVSKRTYDVVFDWFDSARLGSILH